MNQPKALFRGVVVLYYLLARDEERRMLGQFGTDVIRQIQAISVD